MLGYFFDAAREPRSSQFLAAQRATRLTRIAEMATRLERWECPSTCRRCSTRPARDTGKSIGRPRLARAMIDAGHVATTREAFDKWLAQGRPAYRRAWRERHRRTSSESSMALAASCLSRIQAEHSSTNGYLLCAMPASTPSRCITPTMTSTMAASYLDLARKTGPARHRRFGLSRRAGAWNRARCILASGTGVATRCSMLAGCMAAGEPAGRAPRCHQGLPRAASAPRSSTWRFEPASLLLCSASTRRCRRCWST